MSHYRANDLLEMKYVEAEIIAHCYQFNVSSYRLVQAQMGNQLL